MYIYLKKDKQWHKVTPEIDGTKHLLMFTVGSRRYKTHLSTLRPVPRSRKPVRYAVSVLLNVLLLVFTMYSVSLVISDHTSIASIPLFAGYLVMGGFALYNLHSLIYDRLDNTVVLENDNIIIKYRKDEGSDATVLEQSLSELSLMCEPVNHDEIIEV